MFSMWFFFKYFLFKKIIFNINTLKLSTIIKKIIKIIKKLLTFLKSIFKTQKQPLF